LNLILIEEADLVSPGCARLSGRRFEHAATVLKIAERAACRVGLLGGGIGTARLTAFDEQEKTLRLDFCLDSPPPPPLPLTLVIALPRPKTFRKVLHAGITLGVKTFYFINSFKVDKSYWQSPMLSPENCRSEALLALEQAVDTVLPKLHFRPRFKPFVEDELTAVARNSLVLAAHPGAAARCPVDPGGATTLCLGPEGGFTAYEIDLLCRHGARAVGLGNRVLRTEYALPALVSRLYG
jgi:RsmE family RNA methyltransferase